MAAASDKARFFLEQSVPELKDDERKGIFSPEEITSIARKRSDFEHKINARGSTPVDYARYAEFEINVDALRKKRVKRLGVKSNSHAGKRRIFFVFDRGTRKHPGDLPLWMQSIDFAKKQKAYKKLLHIFTTVLRLHPSNPRLWAYAAQFAYEENGDMTEARSYMQRGIRFCKSSTDLWKDYFKLELAYIAKIYARREILGIAGNGDGATQPQEQPAPEEEDENLIRFADLAATDVDPDGGDTDPNISPTPVMSGAIPLAIFDAAVNKFDSPQLGYDLCTICFSYSKIPPYPKILQHIEESMMSRYPSSWQSWAIHVCVAVGITTPQDPRFPTMLRAVLSRLKDARASLTAEKPRFLTWAAEWLQTFDLSEECDPAIGAVIASTLRSLEMESTPSGREHETG